MQDLSSRPPSTRAVELVLEAQGERFAFWAPDGSMYVAQGTDGLGHVTLRVANDPEMPTVTARAPNGKWLAMAERVASSFGVPAAAPQPNCTAVKVVVVVGGDFEVVWAPDGSMRMTSGFAELGAELAKIAADEKQPRCPPGEQDDAAVSLAERVMSTIFEVSGAEAKPG